MTEKPTLLIVDDEKPTREGLRAALEERYDVYIAEDAKAATMLTGVEMTRAHGQAITSRTSALYRESAQVEPRRSGGTISKTMAIAITIGV